MSKAPVNANWLLPVSPYISVPSARLVTQRKNTRLAAPPPPHVTEWVECMKYSAAINSLRSETFLPQLTNHPVNQLSNFMVQDLLEKLIITW